MASAKHRILRAPAPIPRGADTGCYNPDRIVTDLREIDYSLSGPVIHAWFVQASSDPALLARLQSLLGAEEAAKATTFRFEHLRRNYTFTHGVLRILIGRYIGEDPAQVKFCSGPNGKPYIDHSRSVQFNLSHSNDVALMAFAADCEIGVDIEKIRPMNDVLAIASRFFCPEETAELMSMPAGEQQAAFFRCWTRKEAYLKAAGDGMRTDLDSFRVSIRHREPVRFLHINGNSDAAAQWSLHNLDIYPDCAAALAYAGSVRAVRTLPFTPCAAFGCH